MDKYVSLRNGVLMPTIGYGTWQLPSGKETTRSVIAAIECGYRYIDTAYSYGNDFYVGKAIKETGTVRNDLFVANKVYHTFQNSSAVVECCKKSLKLMKLDYFDLYLIHWPAPVTKEGWKEINSEMWSGMEQLYREGCVRSVGTSNFLPHHLEALKEYGAQTYPMVNQVEFHPGCLKEQILEYCHNHQIVVQGWSPLGSSQLLNNQLILELAKKYQKTPAQICLGWALQHNVIPVPRSQNPERMANNLDVYDINITAEDMMLLDSLDRIACSQYIPDVCHPE